MVPTANIAVVGYITPLADTRLRVAPSTYTTETCKLAGLPVLTL